MTTNVEIVPITVADLPRLMELEQASFDDPWSETAMLAMLESPVARALAARSNGQIVGFVLAYLIPPEGEIADVCVAPEARGQGIGRLLMRTLMEDYGCTEFWLEVRISNLPARRLYEKLGFAKVGLRKNYYENPREDAAVMRYTRSEAND